MSSEEQDELIQERIRPIIEWLTSTHGQAKMADAEILREHLNTLRSAAAPATQQLQLLDFLYEHSQRVVSAFLPSLHDISLPIPRRARQQIRSVQALLEGLSQDYFDALTQLLDSEPDRHQRTAGIALWRSINSLTTHLLISNLSASPTEGGIWQMLHQAYRTARRHQLTEQQVARQSQNLEQVYLACIVLACSQPASFSSLELEFIVEYIKQGIDGITLSDELPVDGEGVFWIDPNRDTPANPLSRRSPPIETRELWYFACDDIAEAARQHLDLLNSGYPAHQLGLSAFADKPAGHGVLKRLTERWGKPPKRRFPRRRHAYRATLCSGIEEIWQLLHQPEQIPPLASKWMVTNESPDGCTMMHVSGKTGKFRVGDLIAMRAEAERDAPPSGWIICIIRWAISENPEHIEVGLQIIAPTATPAIVALPTNSVEATQTSSAILLPSVPPLHPQETLVVHSGVFAIQPNAFTLVVDASHLKVRELHVTGITEQTASIEIFSVESAENN